MNKTAIPAAQKTALSLLITDHRNAKKLFKAFEEAGSDREKLEIAQEVCTELTVHAQLEEDVFYPFLRKQGSEFEDMLDEAFVEHASAKQMIAEVQSMKPGDQYYDAKVKVLGEYIEHHVQEEEEEMFQKIISKKLDLRELGEQMKEHQEELKGVVA